MRIKAALVFIAVMGSAGAIWAQEGCHHGHTQISCPSGQAWDETSKSCQVVASS